MEPYVYENIRLIKELHVNFQPINSLETYIPPHWHESLEILLLLQGSLEGVVNHHCSLITEGNFLLVNPREIHSTKSFPKTSYLMLQIPYTTLNAYIPEIDKIQFCLNQHNLTLQQKESYEALKDTFHFMNQLYHEKSKGSHLKFTSLLFELLYQLYHYFQVPSDKGEVAQNNKKLEQLTPVLSYIHQHYAQKIRLQDIASCAGFQPEYFCRFFKRNMGITFMEYLNQYRFNRIIQDLSRTEDSLLSILENHGFSNYKLFRKLFYNTYGCTPKEKRKELSCSTQEDLALQLGEESLPKMNVHVL